jgi:class 3 adenylate cyclase
MTSIPTGTVTFLFTDIEGSTLFIDVDGCTTLAQQHPERWRVMQARRELECARYYSTWP